MKCCNQSSNTGSNLSSAQNTEEKHAFNVEFLFIMNLFISIFTGLDTNASAENLTTVLEDLKSLTDAVLKEDSDTASDTDVWPTFQRITTDLNTQIEWLET